MRTQLLPFSHIFASRAAAIWIAVSGLCMLAVPAFPALAAWDGMPYAPGETLEPECGPTEIQCRIEGTFSAAMADLWFSGKTTDDIIEGVRLYYTLDRFAHALAGTTTDALSEGVTNSYFTDDRARGALSSGTLGLTYDSNTGVLSVASGYALPTTASVAEWNDAYNLRLLSVATPFSLSGNTLELLSGYAIPLAASTTEWHTAYLGRITSASAPLSYDSDTGHFSFVNPGYLTGIEWGDITGSLPDQTDLTNALDGRLALADWYATTTDAIAEGDTHRYYATDLFAGDLAATTTDALVEGLTRLYYTDARVDARLSAATSLGMLTSAPALGTLSVDLNGILKASDGVLTSAIAGSDYETPLTFTYPLLRAGDAVGLAFGTTTSNTWSAANTFTNGLTTNALTLGTVNGFLKATAGAVAPALIDLGTDVVGTLGVPTGGTGWGSIQSGRLMYGNGSGALATTTGEASGYVLQYDGAKPVWVATTTLGFPEAGGDGTVTSVGLSAPTGFSVSGSPITNSGTLALSFATGYGLPLTASTTNWNEFYDAPSSRITPGTNLSWAGLTLNGPSDTHIRTRFSANAPLAYDSSTGAFSLTGTLGVSQGGTGATSFGQGWLYSSGGTDAIAASTSPTVNYLVATSTTQASRFAYRVGIGIAPTSALHVNGDITYETVKGCSGLLNALGTNASGVIFCKTITSDERLKTGITALTDAEGLELINALQPVSYTWQDPSMYGTDALQYGFIAQQAELVAPNLVETSAPTELTPDGTRVFNYFGVIAPLVKSVQELSRRLVALADSVVTKRLCLEDVCITKDELRMLLEEGRAAPAPPPDLLPPPAPETQEIPVDAAPEPHIQPEVTVPDPDDLSAGQ